MLICGSLSLSRKCILIEFLRMAVSMSLIVKVENLKAHIQAAQERASTRVHFFFAFRSERPLVEHLREAHEAMEKIRQKHKNDAV